MKEPMVSILIPMYNAKEHILQCVESALTQSYRDIEVLVMDDGSTDDCGLIVKPICDRDMRLKIYTQKNRGPGGARNALLKLATGKYVLFLDSDDMIRQNTVEVLSNKAEELGTDILIFNGESFISEGHDEKYDRRKYFNIGSCSADIVTTGLERAAKTLSIVSPCMKLFCREFLITNNVLFPEKTNFEDVEFYYQSMFIAKRVSYVDTCLYCRRYRKGSLMTENSMIFMETRINRFARLCELTDVIEDSMQKKAILSQYAMFAAGIWVLVMARKDRNEQQKLLSDFSEQNMRSFVKENRIGIKTGCVYFLMILPRCFDWAKRLICKAFRLILRKRIKLFA